jgi:prepilin-type N-terminal cleavage/methylation domain-containing protein
MRRQKGFTLIELMAVIAILGILATFAAPNFTRMLRHRQFIGSVHGLIAVCNKARAYSMSHGAISTVTLESQAITARSGNIFIARYPANANEKLNPPFAFSLNVLRFNSQGFYIDEYTRVHGSSDLVVTQSKTTENTKLHINVMGSIIILTQ